MYCIVHKLATSPCLQDLEKFFRPIFAMFKEQRLNEEESLGQFVDRIGFEALKDRQLAEGAIEAPKPKGPRGKGKPAPAAAR